MAIAFSEQIDEFASRMPKIDNIFTPQPIYRPRNDDTTSEKKIYCVFMKRREEMKNNSNWLCKTSENQKSNQIIRSLSKIDAFAARSHIRRVFNMCTYFIFAFNLSVVFIDATWFLSSLAIKIQSSLESKHFAFYLREISG